MAVFLYRGRGYTKKDINFNGERMSTQIKTAPLYVTLVGGLAQGFTAIAIDVKSETESLFYKNEARRVHSQYIELEKPEDVLSGYQEDRGGNIVVFVGDVDGGDMFGPFSDEDVAEAFASELIAERDLPEGGFKLFTVTDSHTKKD
jgi:hypothetical protein